MNKETVITIGGSDALITKFAFLDAETIATIFAVIDTACVVAVFVLFRLRDEITVFGFAASIRVLRVYIHMRVHERVEMRHLIAKFFELIEE